MPELLAELPSIFLFKIIGFDGESIRIAFQPNPSFKERNYQDRVVHAMSGVLLVQAPEMRLCELDAHLEHRVEFGYGILGQLSEETHFFLAREKVSPTQWATTKIRVHLNGSMLLLKSISRDVDASRYAFQQVARGLSPADASAIVLAGLAK
ncbi:MAG: hypothetical protein WA510_21440 [Acidobacteriaceae bacterium]